jgi:hypothetical protein
MSIRLDRSALESVTRHRNEREAVMGENNNLLNLTIAVGLLFPLFFQLSGGIYNGYINDSGGNIATLPLPISLLTCFGGMALLIRRFRQADLAWTFAVAMLFVLILSTIFSSSGFLIEYRKLLLLAQFILPVFALALGQLVFDDDKAIPKGFLVVLLTIVPLQLMAGWMQGSLSLTHSLYVFSIYQHFQFVPLVFVAAFAFVTTALWATHQRTLLMLFPFMLIYVMASASFLTVAAFMVFIASFAVQQVRVCNSVSPLIVIAIVLTLTAVAILGIGSHLNIAVTRSFDYGDHGAYIRKFQSLLEGKLPVNATERWADWKLFGNGIVESLQTMFFGHVAPLAREVRTSAHNWYLDIAYTFGLISLLPIFVLIGYTIYLFWRRRTRLPLDTRWLAFIVCYLVVIDNNFKVSLRQPYSGIFTYFLWGLLLSRLTDSDSLRSCREVFKK